MLVISMVCNWRSMICKLNSLIKSAIFFPNPNSFRSTHQRSAQPKCGWTSNFCPNYCIAWALQTKGSGWRAGQLSGWSISDARFGAIVANGIYTHHNRLHGVWIVEISNQKCCIRFVSYDREMIAFAFRTLTVGNLMFYLFFFFILRKRLKLKSNLMKLKLLAIIKFQHYFHRRWAHTTSHWRTLLQREIVRLVSISTAWFAHKTFWWTSILPI